MDCVFTGTLIALSTTRKDFVSDVEIHLYPITISVSSTILIVSCMTEMGSVRLRSVVFLRVKLSEPISRPITGVSLLMSETFSNRPVHHRARQLHLHQEVHPAVCSPKFQYTAAISLPKDGSEFSQQLDFTMKELPNMM